MAEKQPVAASLEETYYSSFVLREEDLSKLNELVREYLGSNAEVSFYFTCSDRTTREYDTVAAAKKYENPKDRRITALWLYASSDDRRKTVSIRLTTRRVTNVAVALKGPGMSIATCQKKLEDWFAGVRPWYARLTHPIVYFLAPVLIVTLLSSLELLWSLLTKGWVNKPLELTPAFFVRMLLSSLFGIGGTLGVASLQNWLFPAGVFAIGHGLERERRLAAIRSVIFVVVILGLLVGVVGSLIASFAFQAIQPAP